MHALIGVADVHGLDRNYSFCGSESHSTPVNEFTKQGITNYAVLNNICRMKFSVFAVDTCITYNYWVGGFCSPYPVGLHSRFRYTNNYVIAIFVAFVAHLVTDF